MDLSTARALKIVCNINRVQEIMVTLSKDETKTFALNSMLHQDVPDAPLSPANRCRMKRGGGRCRGTVSELSLTQMCTYHQVRRTGDLNLDGLRCFSTAHPGLFQSVFGRNNPDWAAR